MKRRASPAPPGTPVLIITNTTPNTRNTHTLANSGVPRSLLSQGPGSSAGLPAWDSPLPGTVPYAPALSSLPRAHRLPSRKGRFAPALIGPWCPSNSLVPFGQ